MNVYIVSIWCGVPFFDREEHFSVISLCLKSPGLVSAGFDVALLSRFQTGGGIEAGLKCRWLWISKRTLCRVIYVSSFPQILNEVSRGDASITHFGPSWSKSSVFVVVFFNHKAIFWATSLNVQYSAVPVEIVYNSLILFVNCCCISGV